MRPQIDDQSVRRRVTCLLLLAGLVGGCAEEKDPGVAEWTVQQAESITSVRGMSVRVRYCRGLAGSFRGEAKERFRRFVCLAGARASFDRYDTVGVLYMLRPLGDYDGPDSRHRLSNVRFVGGPGIP